MSIAKNIQDTHKRKNEILMKRIQENNGDGFFVWTGNLSSV